MYKEQTKEDLKKLFGLNADYKVDACIIYGSYAEKELKRNFLKLLNDKEYKIEKLTDFLEKILSVEIEGRRIWFIVEYGGARLSEFVHFASMFGSKSNIVLGSCGGLKTGLGKNGLIVPSYSHSEDSGCKMYQRDNKEGNYYSDEALSLSIIQRMGSEVNITRGPIVTCQAMMAETWEDIVEWSQAGYIGVEMETSTVFAVSKHFNVPAAAILIVADNLIEKETIDSESYKARKKERDKLKVKLMRTALELSLTPVNQ